MLCQPADPLLSEKVSFALKMKQNVSVVSLFSCWKIQLKKDKKQLDKYFFKWFGLEGTLKLTQLQPPATGRDTSHQSEYNSGHFLNR